MRSLLMSALLLGVVTTPAGADPRSQLLIEPDTPTLTPACAIGANSDAEIAMPQLFIVNESSEPMTSVTVYIANRRDELFLRLPCSIAPGTNLRFLLPADSWVCDTRWKLKFGFMDGSTSGEPKEIFPCDSSIPTIAQIVQ